MAAHKASSSSGVPQFRVFLFLFTFAQIVPLSWSQGSIPPMVCDPDYLYLFETEAEGSVITKLRATVNSGTYPAVNLTLRIDEDNTMALVNLTQAVHVGNDVWQSDVILIAELDSDYDTPNRQLSFVALDSEGNRNNHLCHFTIRDVNDNAPSFEGLPYEIRVTENTTVGTLLMTASATDPDTVGSPPEIQRTISDPEVDAVFRDSQGNDTTVMNIQLAEPLDYERRTFYSFELMAIDQGGLNTTEIVRVHVVDVQDTPPIFLLQSYRAAIREMEPKGTHVIHVSAVDGDRDPPNEISYSIVSGNTDYFAIDNVTGEITSLVALDRDNSTMVGSDGIFHLVVQASEIPGSTPQYGNTTTNVTVVVVVEDVNDNIPTFGSSAPYTAFVREDIVVDSLIYFAGDGYISVSDADQGSNSHFNLTVERDGLPWPMLEATPSDIYSEALVLLRVKDAEVFKNAVGTHIVVQVVAREVSTTQRNSSTAEVVITVEKMEDVPSTPLPIVDNSTTASDVVVFIIGFLVVFNIAATVFIVWYLRRKPREPKQGLVRKGSKYYVNGVDTAERNSSGFQNGSAVTLRPESIMVELEGKDRCDVVPLSAMLAENKRLSQASAALSSKMSGAHRDSGSLIYETVESGNSERKVLVANEVSPATKSGSSPVAGSKPKIVITKADVSSSRADSPTSTTATATTSSSSSSSSAPLPDFSMAKRNVSTPHNPSLSFTNPSVTTAASPNTSTFQIASTAFPSASTATTTTASSAEPATASTVVEPVTTFSAKGVVSTTVTAVPEYALVSKVPKGGNDVDGTSPKPEGSESMSELLY